MPPTRTTTANSISATKRAMDSQRDDAPKKRPRADAARSALLRTPKLPEADALRATELQREFEKAHEHNASHTEPIDGRWVPFGWITTSNATATRHSTTSKVLADGSADPRTLTPYGCFNGRDGTLSLRVREFHGLEITVDLKSFLHVNDIAQIFHRFDSAWANYTAGHEPRRAFAHAQQRRSL